MTAIPRRTRRRPRNLRGLLRSLTSYWHLVRLLLGALWKSHPVIRIPVLVAVVALLWLGSNWIYQAVHKPTELLFPFEQSLAKSPRETWERYGALFQKHSTAVIAPELLAALAQVEGTGNPVARTYWRWNFTSNPLEMYKPASSAVGMYQITDATFREAQRYCIHDHEVATEGALGEVRSCWFNSLYFRVVPSHAIELTSAFLDRSVAGAVQGRRSPPQGQLQDLAAIIHLCGAGAGRNYVARGFRLTLHQRCGDHDVGLYLTRVHDLKRRFSALAAGNGLAHGATTLRSSAPHR